jgi:hypothetical protein
MRLACRWSVDQMILGQSTPRRTWSGSLALPLFLHGTDGILLPDGATHEQVEGPALERHRLLMDLGTQSLAEQGCLLHIRIDVVCTILRVIETPLNKQEFVSQDPTGGFLMKQECANTHISIQHHDIQVIKQLLHIKCHVL